MDQNSSVNRKVQSIVPEYILHIIENLKHFYGNSQSDVVSKMLVDWASDNKELLEKLNIDSFKEWKAKQVNNMRTDEFKKLLEENKKLSNEVASLKADQFDKWMKTQLNLKKNE